MAYEFKVGDKVKIIGNGNPIEHNFSIGETCEVRQVNTHNCSCVSISFKEQYVSFEDLQLITNKTNMNLKEKFIQAFLTEPEKSFRKAGITNGDGILTTEGQEILLTWLLKREGNAFKKEVVDQLLENEDEK